MIDVTPEERERGRLTRGGVTFIYDGDGGWVREDMMTEAEDLKRVADARSNIEIALLSEPHGSGQPRRPLWLASYAVALLHGADIDKSWVIANSIWTTFVNAPVSVETEKTILDRIVALVSGTADIADDFDDEAADIPENFDDREEETMSDQGNEEQPETEQQREGQSKSQPGGGGGGGTDPGGEGGATGTNETADQGNQSDGE